MVEMLWVNRKKVTVTDEDIDGIMAAALEGGITYWCDKVEVIGERFGKYASEQIARGGTLRIYGSDEISGAFNWLLNKEKFMKGLKKFLTEDGEANECLCREDDGYSLECAYIDADGADIIIQNALFGEQVYG